MVLASPSSTEDHLNNLARSSHTIVFQGRTFSLLDTYENPDAALNEYQTYYSDELRIVQEKYDLPELSAETAAMYKQVFIAEGLDTKESVRELVRFLDLYENPSENAEIIEQLAQFDLQVTEGTLTQEEAVSLARMWLPTKPENGNDQPTYALRNSGIDLDAVREYASKYDTEINEKYGEEKTWRGAADCTNFASQILHAGGIGMKEYNDEAKGWWWKAKGRRSISWINANVFKNYMGSGFSTQNWVQLRRNVRAGDFIALDYESDGTVDHIGFVYRKSISRLMIAQHTINYLDWNGNWPTYKREGTYYRVHR